MVHPVAAGAGSHELFAHARALWPVLWDSHRAPREKVRDVLEIETDAFDLPVGFLSRIDGADDRETFEVVSTDSPPISAGNSVPVSQTYCRKTIEAPNGTLAVSDAPSNGWSDDPAYELFGLDTYLGATVDVDGDLYGTLCFTRTDARQESITGPEIDMVVMLAEWVGYELTVRNDRAPVGAAGDVAPAGRTPADALVDAGPPVSLLPEEADRVMDALARGTRRVVLAALLDSERVSRDDLLADDGTGASDGPGIQDSTALEHNHLPRLADGGFVEWDRVAGTIERGPAFEDVEPVLHNVLDSVDEVA